MIRRLRNLLAYWKRELYPWFVTRQCDKQDRLEGLRVSQTLQFRSSNPQGPRKETLLVLLWHQSITEREQRGSRTDRLRTSGLFEERGKRTDNQCRPFRVSLALTNFCQPSAFANSERRRSLFEPGPTVFLYLTLTPTATLRGPCFLLSL